MVGKWVLCAADRPVYVLNGTGKAGVTVDLAAAPKSVEVYDTFGGRVAAPPACRSSPSPSRATRRSRSE